MKTTELRRFKERLLNMRPHLTDEIQRSIETVQEEVQPPGEDTKEPSSGIDKELVLERTQEDMLNAINDALDRIEAGTYGRCVECGQEITLARLNAIPYTPYCIACERAVEVH
jgi:RNA polymerase-binding protein DksA